MLLCLALIPACLIHTRSTDWGDDYAQYIYQAQHIGHYHTPYAEVLNADVYGSPRKSIFFSLCLSMIKPALSISPYLVLNTCFYVLSALSVFFFFTRLCKPYIAFILTLLLYYYFRMLDAKEEVLPEFVFMALFYTVLYLQLSVDKSERRSIPEVSRSRIITWLKKHKSLISAILLACLLATRSLALALIIPCMLTGIKKNLHRHRFNMVIGVSAFTISFILIQTCLLPGHASAELGFYSGLISRHFSVSLILQNILSYTKTLPLLFEFEIPSILNRIASGLFTILFLSGLWNMFMKQQKFLAGVLFLYIAGLCLYPYNGDAIRYLIPILPLIFLILYHGCEFLSGKLPGEKNHIIAAIFIGLFFVGANLKTILVNKTIRHLGQGPFERSVIKDFQTIGQLVKPSESIAFCKPYLVNWLTERNSYYLHPDSVVTRADYILYTRNENLAEPCHFNPHTLPNIEDTICLSNFYLFKVQRKTPTEN